MTWYFSRQEWAFIGLVMACASIYFATGNAGLSGGLFLGGGLAIHQIPTNDEPVE